MISQLPTTQIKELFVYYFPEPPYFLMSAGLLAGMASGVAFEATLKQAVQQWSKNRSTRTLANLPSLDSVGQAFDRARTRRFPSAGSGFF